METADELLRGPGPAALLTLDGTVVELNEAMAAALGRPSEQCAGRGFSDLWPPGRRAAPRELVSHAAAGKSVAMRVLDFAWPAGAAATSSIELTEARQVRNPSGHGSRVWLHALDVRNDVSGLLIPFCTDARTARLGVLTYSAGDHSLEWLGGAPSVGAIFPESAMPLDRVLASVHPEDRETVRRMLDLPSPRSPWTTVRYRAPDSDWHRLGVRTRRIRLGHDGPSTTLGLVRDDTREGSRRPRRQTALLAERQRAREVADFSAALVAAATEQELQQVVLTRLAATFGASGALLALVDDGGRLRVLSDAGAGTREVDAVDGADLDAPSPLPEAIRTGRPQFVSDRRDYTRRWPRAAELPRLTRLGPDQAFAIAPLGEGGDQPLGGFMVACGSGRRLSLKDRTLMATLADLAGQALGRIRLQQARVRLAVTLQEAMLPALPEHLAGLEVAARYRPSGHGLDIGGDWYDAYVMPDGTVALGIGDVQGHDVDAAAFMGQVSLSMRAIAGQDPDPGTVLTRTNQLLATLDHSRFASCAMLRIDPRDGQVTGTSAGHVPLLYARKDGSHTVHQLPGGPVLGIVAETEYGEGTFVLDRDSALVMVTDGLVEGPGLSLDAGLDRAGELAAAAVHDGLDAERIADRIVEAAGAADHDDDQTVLVIRRA
ncbi:SpoIIE family protein phosphatase [Actinacidiphila acidipaludis]|uniref:SpoIIE family protein phosphatase n=1 Tax=Actinacidiphila acidipaludis TaxID=2873382 RepID=A0ABS7QL50_9ACTN|nr:SpoIIE family protein phosphatase [Streptomyces acidipaludis]MBY8882524.1 SpoIIE family protein phosphatase [Streptomyces acidipaludis]